jgi:hypothetical protein
LRVSFADIAESLKNVQFFRAGWGEPTHGVMREQAVMFLAVGKGGMGNIPIDFLHV